MKKLLYIALIIFLVSVPSLLTFIAYQNSQKLSDKSTQPLQSDVAGTNTDNTSTTSTVSEVERTTLLDKRFPTGMVVDKNAFSTIVNVPDSVNIENIDDVFNAVFSQIGNEVTVMPSENYFYFRFSHGNSDFWGNIRFALADRDEGKIHFAYYEYNEDPQGPNDTYSKYKVYTSADTPKLTKLADLKYQIVNKDKTVIFNLNNTPQDFDNANLAPGEKYIMNTYDESGLGFSLIYNGTNSFLWLLNEKNTDPAKLNFTKLNDNTQIDQRSKFIFYTDAKVNNRKILIGVSTINIKRNSYFDGPFDQLAENFMKGNDESFKNELYTAYKYADGYLDNYGKFVGVEENRMAITPYYNYDDPSEIENLVTTCTANNPNHDQAFYTCLAYDYKSRI